MILGLIILDLFGESEYIGDTSIGQHAYMVILMQDKICSYVLLKKEMSQEG